MDYQLSNGLISLRRFCKVMKLAMREDGILSPPLSELFDKACVECFPEGMLDPSLANTFNIRLLDGDVLVKPEDHGMSIHCFLINELNMHSIWAGEGAIDTKTEFDSRIHPCLNDLSNDLLKQVQLSCELDFDEPKEPEELAREQNEYLEMLCLNLSEIEKANARRFLRENGYIDIHAINRRREALRSSDEKPKMPSVRVGPRLLSTKVINLVDMQA